MNEVKGYKVFRSDWTCKPGNAKAFQYEVGKTYEEKGDLSFCNCGFHFCKRATDCFEYYPFNPEFKVAEVVALGDVLENGDKCCTNKIYIVREITWQELLTIINIGKSCTGRNNSGDWNSGNMNSGNWNSGNGNSGNGNSGNRNSGNMNSGDWNSGDWNSGNGNSGNMNSGDWNSGDWNSGDWNSGDGNSGNRNSGNRNSGDWNSGDGNSGCFNTTDNMIYLFDRLSHITLEDWNNSKACSLFRRVKFYPTEWICKSDMTEEEKKSNTSYETCGGYLKENDTTTAFTDWWCELSESEKNVIRSIENFDITKFFKITGINA